MIRLKWPYHALWLWPGAVLVESYLVSCRAEQVASIVVEGDVVHGDSSISDVHERALLVKAVDAANVLILPGRTQIRALV
jgi:hypothetical protein